MRIVKQPVMAILILLTGSPLAGDSLPVHGEHPHAAMLRQAFTYLNKIRANPASYSLELGVRLSDVKRRPPLRWNSKLARSAQRKAEDMARRGYFAHIDPDGRGPNRLAQAAGYPLPHWWSKKPGANNIESISAGRKGGKPNIRALIRDQGLPHPQAGHRRHLLGFGRFWSRHVDIGIGIAYNRDSPYRWYFVVHTAQPGP